MKPGLVVKLRPTGPWRIGPDSGARNRVDVIYHSDSLFSAVTSAMARMGLLEDWLNATARSQTPAVCFSSCFPFMDEIGFVVPPRTAWPPVSPSLMAAQVRWKSARFIPLGMVQSVLAGEKLNENRWSVDGGSGCLVPAGRQGPFRTGVRWSAAVDRLSGASERHSMACIEFRPGAGLWTVAGFADEASRDQWQEPVKAAFRWLADSGFGGERSRGWGRSEAPEFIEGELPGMILATAPPAKAEPVAPEAPAQVAPDMVEAEATSETGGVGPIAVGTHEPSESGPDSVQNAPPAEATESEIAEAHVTAPSNIEPLEVTAESVEPEAPAAPPEIEPAETAAGVFEPEVAEAHVNAPSNIEPLEVTAEVVEPEAPLARPEIEPAAVVAEVPVTAQIVEPETLVSTIEELPAGPVEVAAEVSEPEAAEAHVSAPSILEPLEVAAEPVEAEWPAPMVEELPPAAPMEVAAGASEPEVVEADVSVPTTIEPLEVSAETVQAEASAPIAEESPVGLAEPTEPSPVQEPPDVEPPQQEPPPVEPPVQEPVPEPEPIPPAKDPLAPVEEPGPPPPEPVPDETHKPPVAEPEMQAAPAKSRTAGQAHWMLSLFAPAPADTVDWARGSYTVMARGGRVDSPAGSGELKKQVQMIAEGSVLIAERPPCGAAPDVAPEGFAHPVFRAGFALCIPLPEGN